MVDNCPAHPHIGNLKFIKLVFLPPNTSAILQPMDQGVIRCLKSHYKRFFLTRLLYCLERKENFKVSLLDAIVMISTAWGRVTSKTIENCFRHASFKESVFFDEDDELPLSQWILKYADDEDDNVPLSTWVHKNNVNAVFSNEEDIFANIDNELTTTELPTDAELLSKFSEADLEDVIGSDTDEDEVEPPTIGEVYNAMNVLSTYIGLSNVENNIKEAFNLLQNKIERDMLTKKSVQ